MKRVRLATVLIIIAAFCGGFFSHVLYQRWNPPSSEPQEYRGDAGAPERSGGELKSFRATFAPLPAVSPSPELPVMAARDVEKIRSLAGNQARIRGRIFRVGHSAKSNTYFLNFGPSREALTAVIFASAVELFEKDKLSVKGFEGREVEVQGEIKNHPQYGLEVILENPSQIKVLD